MKTLKIVVMAGVFGFGLPFVAFAADEDKINAKLCQRCDNEYDECAKEVDSGNAWHGLGYCKRARQSCAYTRDVERLCLNYGEYISPEDEFKFEVLESVLDGLLN